MNKKKDPLISTIFLHLFIIEFLFFSGEAYYTSTLLGGGGKIKFGFVLTCFLYFLTAGKRHVVKSNVVRLLFIIIWPFLCTYVFGQGNHGLQWTEYTLFATGVFLIVSSTDFYSFRNILYRYLFILTVVSIIVQIGHDYFGIFPAVKYVDGGGEDRYLSLGLFTTEWGEYRLASIYWEPGQYQIVIYYIIVLFADEWSAIENWRKSFRKFGIILLAIIMTASTTAYLLLMLVVLVIIIRNGRLYFMYLPLILAIGGLSIFMLFNSEAVQNKVEMKENADVKQSSFTIRLADNVACLMVTLEDPLTGYGPGSDEMEKKLYSEGSLTSSNGWLYGAAQLGIPYIIFVLICFWHNLKEMNIYSNKLLLFLILVIAQSNEAFIRLPYIYMYIFSFYYYAQKK